MTGRIALAVETLALALWVGGLATFAFVFAPVAFHAVADKAVFGTMTARILGILGTVGFLCGALSVAMEVVRGGARFTLGAGAGTVRLVLIAVMLAGTALESAFVIPQMIATAPYAVLAHDDPRWAAFDAEHHRSSTIYGIVLLCGIAAIASLAFTASRKDSPAQPRT